MPDPLNTAFHDLREIDFPFHVDFLDADTGDLVRTLTVDGPGAVQVPSRADLGCPVDVRLRFPSGHWVRTNLDGTETCGHS